jgi:hypothetical protein
MGLGGRVLSTWSRPFQFMGSLWCLFIYSVSLLGTIKVGCGYPNLALVKVAILEDRNERIEKIPRNTDSHVSVLCEFESMVRVQYGYEGFTSQRERNRRTQ